MTITDPFTTPATTGLPSPAAVALAAQCRKAKALADTAPTRFEQMPAPPPPRPPVARCSSSSAPRRSPTGRGGRPGSGSGTPAA
ncbi:hypothetical protein ACN24M_20265 [Streptomyces microflavus]